MSNFPLDWAIHSMIPDRETLDSARPDAKPPVEHRWAPPFGGGHGWVNSGNTSSTSTNDPNGGATTSSDPATTASTTTMDSGNMSAALNDAWSSWPLGGAGQSGGAGQYYSSGSVSSQVIAGSQLQSDDPETFWDFDTGRDHFEALRTLLHDQPAILDPVDPAPEPASVFLLAALFAIGLLVARHSRLGRTQFGASSRNRNAISA